MGRQKQVQILTEVGEALARFKAWRMTRKNGARIPADLWSEAAELARRLASIGSAWRWDCATPP